MADRGPNGRDPSVGETTSAPHIGGGRLRRVAHAGAAADLIAGGSVALVLIPQSLAYAELAGMPPYRGLYASGLPLLAAALLASSPYLQTGPVAITSLLTLGALGAMAPQGGAEYVQLGLALALVVGVVRVLLGLLRAGVIAYLMSQPMLMGFIPAAAVLIVASQVPTALGADVPEGGVPQRALSALADPAGWRPEAVLLTIAVLVLTFGGRRVHPLFPGVLVAVTVAIVYSRVGGYDGDTLGDIPAGAPPLSLDLPWRELPSLLVPGAVIALVGFAEPASIARTFATQERRPWDANREFISQGAANVVAGLSGGFPVGGSFSRSALNRIAGARTRLSGAVTGIVVLAVLPFASVLSPLPKAVLGAVVIGAAVTLIRIPPLFRLWRHSRPQFAVAWITFALTLALAPHVERAVVIGVGLAIGVHLWRELHIDIQVSHDGGTLRLRPAGVLWFGAAQGVQDALIDCLVQHPEAKRLAIDLTAVGRLDMTGALALRAVVDEARASGLEVDVEGVHDHHRRLVTSVVMSAGDPLAGPVRE